MAIYLGSSLLRTSSDLTRPVFPPPEAEGNSNGLFFPLRERGLFGLAPGGVYPAAPIAQSTGELLPHLFTLTLWKGGFACPTGGMFSVALSLPPAYRPGTVRVTDHPALRSSDFPPLPIAPYYGVSEGATICSPSTPLLFLTIMKMTHQLSGSKDFIFYFDLPPKRECGYSGDTERWCCFFELR